jgi:hypothetical protein
MDKASTIQFIQKQRAECPLPHKTISSTTRSLDPQYDTRVSNTQRRVKQQSVYQQKITKSTHMAAKNVWDYFEPVADCPVRERVGGFSDGAKWVCKNHNMEGCRVYSFGSAGQIGFELEMIEQHGCETFTFDPNPKSNPTIQKGMCYFAVGMGPTPSGWDVVIDGVKYPTLSLVEIAKTLNHSTIDILKIDIEGSEWASVPHFLKEEGFVDLRVSQIMIELHYAVNQLSNASNLKDLFTALQDSGYYAFSKEPNLLCGPQCCEYSFLHISKF